MAYWRNGEIHEGGGDAGSIRGGYPLMIYTPAITITPASSHIHHHPYTITPYTIIIPLPPLVLLYRWSEKLRRPLLR